MTVRQGLREGLRRVIGNQRRGRRRCDRRRIEQIIEQVHARGLKICGGTLTPFKGAFYYSGTGEAKRQTVNEWIRTSGAFDGVIDFDLALQDPADPLQLLPLYDSGDYLHPSDAGYKAMAIAVDLSLFKRARSKR